MAITMGSLAKLKANLTIAQGQDNFFAFRYSTKVEDVVTPVDLSGWTGHGQVRTSIGGEVLLDIIPELFSDGKILLHVSAQQTEAIVTNKRVVGVWDLELYDPEGLKTRFVEGEASIYPDVTRVVIPDPDPEEGP